MSYHVTMPNACRHEYHSAGVVSAGEKSTLRVYSEELSTTDIQLNKCNVQLFAF